MLRHPETMSMYDVIVVGAGPGGSNAAAAVLNRGLSVAQIDARRFPRVKPCAGGLTIKACNSLLLELEPTLKRKFADVQFNAWGHAGHRFRHRSQMMAMVLRPEFDNALVRQNRKHANLALFDGEPVNEITFDGSLFSVRTAQRRLRARQLIGADGA